MAERDGNFQHLMWCKSSGADAEGSSAKKRPIVKTSLLMRHFLFSLKRGFLLTKAFVENLEKHRTTLAIKSILYLIPRYVDSVPKNSPRDTLFARGSG